MTLQRKIIVSLLVLELAVAALFRVESSQRLPSLPVSELGGQESGLLADMRRLEDEHDPTSVESWLAVADFYSTFGLLPQAEYCLQQAARIEELDENGLMLYGVVLSRMGRLEEAQPFFEEVIAAALGRAEDARIELALDLLRQNKIEAAEAALRAAEQEPLIKLALARVLIRTERAQEAIELLDRLLQQQPAAMRAMQMKGWAAESLGESRLASQQAELALRNIQRIDMRTPTRQHEREMHQRYGPGRHLVESGRHEQAGNPEAAIAAMQDAVAAMMPLWRYHYAMRLAVLHLSGEQPGKALAYLQEVYQIEGESAEMWDLVGDAWQQLEDPQKARRAWLEGTRFRASKTMLANEQIHLKLSRSFQEAGDQAAADHHAGLAHYERGRLAWRENDLRQALTSYNEAVKRVPENPACWFHLAETRRVMNDASGARDAYRRCLALSPDHGRAQRGWVLAGGKSP